MPEQRNQTEEVLQNIVLPNVYLLLDTGLVVIAYPLVSPDCIGSHRLCLPHRPPGRGDVLEEGRLGGQVGAVAIINSCIF